MADCTLCALPTPDPPHTAPGLEGVFCCRGCLEVARSLSSLDDRVAAEVERDLHAPAETAAGDDPGGLVDSTDPETGDGGAAVDAEETYLSVDGMHCATCERFVESLAARSPGVHEAEASYASELVRVSYDPDVVDEAGVADALSRWGYAARTDDADRDATAGLRPLVFGGVFALLTMYWYVLVLYPTYLGLDPVLFESRVTVYHLLVVWFAATVVLFYTGQPILRGAYVSLRTRQPNMDLLVSLAAVNAYVYSAVAVLTGHTEVYFDITVAVVLVVTLGTRYEARVKQHASTLLSTLTETRVDRARRRVRGGTETVSVTELDAGDELLVKPGERIPVDGRVLEGSAAVDESLLTGESTPVAVTPGADVVGGAVVTDGPLVVSVSADATSTLDRLVTLLWDIQTSRPGAQRLADRIAAGFVPVVLALAVGTALTHALLLSASPTAAFLTGLTVLIVSCPCALGLATPLAVSAGVREAIDRGIVVQRADLFERTREVDVVALDKTGTLTTGEMTVTAVRGGDEAALLRDAAALEQYSSHPVADAVLDAVAPPTETVTAFERHPGRGVSGRVDGASVLVGSLALFSARAWTVSAAIEERVTAARDDGDLPVVVGRDGVARGVVVVGDEARTEWTDLLDSFLEDDRDVVVITGDEEAATRRFREHPAVQTVHAGVTPDRKAELVEAYAAETGVAMVGDGSNDAPALAAATVGIAIGDATALAADAADATIVDGDLTAVREVFDVTAATRRRIRQNLAWAFGYNIVAIPLAAVGALNPLFAALAMSASSVVVVGNSTRPFAAPDESEDAR